LSAISVVGSHLPIAAGSADVIFKSKNESYKLKSVLCDDYGRRCDFSRTLLMGHHDRRKCPDRCVTDTYLLALIPSNPGKYVEALTIPALGLCYKFRNLLAILKLLYSR
jgi:hypothetical protein